MNFQIWAIAQGVWGRKYSGVQCEAPIAGLGNEVTQKLKQFADIADIVYTRVVQPFGYGGPD